MRVQCRFTTAAAMILTVTGQAQAAGFALIEQSASGMGNAFAGAAASAEDASTIYFNPAGLTYLRNNQLSVAGHVVKPSAEFSGTARNPLGTAIAGNGGGDAGTLGVIPNLYYSHRLPNEFVIGVGINAPFGLKTEYDDDLVGRYQALESEVKTVNINPAIAYRAGANLSVGVGLNVQYIEATLSQAVNQFLACAAVLGAGPCAALAGEDDMTAEISGDDWSMGYNLGLMYDLAEGSRVGLSYRARVKQRLEGDAAFSGAASTFSTLLTPYGLFVPTTVTAGVTLPESASLSLYHEFGSDWAILADATWTRWSRFHELRVQFGSNQPDSVTLEDWDNSTRYSLGINYRAGSAWLLRAGVALDEEPIPSAERRTPRIPGNDRTWLAFGANYRYSAAISFDLGYAHLFVDDTLIDNTDDNGFNITGGYDNSVDIFSAQMNWAF